MKVPLSWLSEFIDLRPLEELTATLDDLGLVVEAVEHQGEGLTDVVVARVEEIRAIPGADKIRLVVADAGHGPVDVVCGAHNFAVGDLVPFAPVGAILPGGMEIAQRTMRGVTSNGMLCSGRELGLSDDHEGLLVLERGGAAVPGAPIVDALGVGRDVILDLSPEGNRPDAWSIEGVARDLAARWDQPLRRPPVTEPSGPPTSEFASAEIVDVTLCGTFTLSAVRQVTVGPSAPWLQRRLQAVGLRPINNVVDVSNYVMVELGQPTHPYDAALIAGHRLGVRRARPEEPLVLLDGSELTLGVPGRGLGDTGVDAVIVDGEDRVVGLAGIMGGANSVISSSTTDVLLEAAFFDPLTVARTSKRLGVRTDASSRFERGVDPLLGSRAAARFVELLRETSPALVWLSSPLEVVGERPTPPTVELSAEQIEALLGTAIPLTVAAPLLRAIGFTVAHDANRLSVTAPSARLDVREGAAGRADVIEEIARLFSYQRLARRTPTWSAPGGLSGRGRLRRAVRAAFVGAGLLEAWTDSFVGDDEFAQTSDAPLRVRATNPMSTTAPVLRGDLLGGLARAWATNVERGAGEVALFEIGNVFEHPGWTQRPRRSRGGLGGAEKVELPTERELALAVLGRAGDDATTAVALWHLVAERLGLEDVVVRQSPAPLGWHPTRAAALVDRASAAVVGHVGELDPALVAGWAPSARPGQRVGLIALDLDVLADPGLVVRARPSGELPSRFPPARIDLAFLTPDEVNAADVAHALRGASDLCESVELFDVYRGAELAAGTRSLAFAVVLRAPDRTLDDGAVADARRALIATASVLGARLR